MCNSPFFVGNKKIDNVDRLYNEGNIITPSLIDGDDIVQRWNTFVGETNNTAVEFKLVCRFVVSQYHVYGATLGLK
jgi:hypothetical protein